MTAIREIMLIAPKNFRKKCGAGIKEINPKIDQNISGTQIQ
jgi:hypothetical protein